MNLFFTKVSFTGLALFWGLTSLFAQEAPRIIPPSPEAAALAKYVECPVSLYTGTPSIDIPLLEVAEKNIKLPISLSYHAGGHRVNDYAGATGLGWSMQAGGVITRSVQGRPDEMGGGFWYTAKAYDYQDMFTKPAAEKSVLYESIHTQCTDTEPDIFYFNFMGYSGKFSFDWDGNLQVASDKKVKISTPDITATTSSGRIATWQVIGEDGTVYLFAAAESSQVKNYGTPSCSWDFKPNTSWNLTKVTSADGLHSITFEYELYTINYFTPGQESITYNNAMGVRNQTLLYFLDMAINGQRLTRITGSSNTFEVLFNKNTTARTDVAGTNLFGLGEVVLRNGQGDQIKKYTFAYDQATGRHSLKTLTEEALTSDGRVVKLPPYSFTYYGPLPDPKSAAIDHWGFANAGNGGAGDMSLLAPVTFLRSDGRYQFLPGVNREPNGTATLAGLLRKIGYPTGRETTFDFEAHSYSFDQSREIREPVKVDKNHPPIYVASGLSGGIANVHLSSSSFVVVAQTDDPVMVNVQANLDYFGTNFSAGGAFMPQVSIKDATGYQYFVHSYSGKNALSKATTLMLKRGTYYVEAKATRPDIGEKDQNGQLIPNDYVQCWINWQDETTELFTPIKVAGGARIKQIVEYDGVTHGRDIVRVFDYHFIENNILKSNGVILGKDFKYYYFSQYIELLGPIGDNKCSVNPQLTRTASNRFILGATSGSHIGYRQVSVKYGLNAENGKSTHSFSSPFEFPDEIYTEPPFQRSTSNDHRRGELKEQIEYQQTDTGYKPVKKLIQTQLVTTVSIPALKIVRSPGDCPPETIFYMGGYAVGAYTINLGFSRLSTKEEIVYDQAPTSATITQKEEYFYDNPAHQQLTRSTTTNSKSEKLQMYLTYPLDYTDNIGVIQELKDAHVVNLPIEKVNYREDVNETNGTSTNQRVISGVYYTYKPGSKGLNSETWLLEISQPILLTNFKFSNKVANITLPHQVANELFVPDNRYAKRITYNSYLQGNLTQVTQTDGQPTVYVWGHKYAMPIAAVSNATTAQVFHTSFEDEQYVSVMDAMARTGRKSHSGSFQVPIAPATGQYILSYWKKTTANGKWVYQQQSLTGNGTQPSITVDVTDLIDEVRLYPVGAQMTTYTYDALVGTTSLTNVANLTTYYEYDAFKRLQYVRDQDRNILKDYVYHYKGQQP